MSLLNFFKKIFFESCDVFAALQALAGKVAIDYTDLDADSEDGMLDDIKESGGVLTSAGVETTDEEDLSVYGRAYEAFGKGKDGKEACMALAALCEVASINTLLSNFIEPLQVRHELVHVVGYHCSSFHMTMFSYESASCMTFSLSAKS